MSIDIKELPIDPWNKEYPGPFSGSDAPLNAFWAFPLEDRERLFHALMFASEHVPTQLELITYFLENDLPFHATDGGEKYDDLYGRIADIFGKQTDKSFDRESPDPASKAVQYREAFYRMIRKFTQEDLASRTMEIFRSGFDQTF